MVPSVEVCADIQKFLDAENTSCVDFLICDSPIQALDKETNACVDLPASTIVCSYQSKFFNQASERCDSWASCSINHDLDYSSNTC